MDYQNIANVRHSVYDLDPTPKAGTNFRFTPSLLDPNSSAFAAFANQPPGYYTPTPGGSTYAMQSYDLGGAQNETYNTPDSMSHPNPHPPSLFQSQLHPLDQQNYIHFRGHPYTQDSYQGLSISGSAAGGAVSESSPSIYSPEAGSGPETTDRELYLAQEVQGKYIASATSADPELYNQYLPSISTVGIDLLDSALRRRSMPLLPCSVIHTTFPSPISISDNPTPSRSLTDPLQCKIPR
jgi:hypothetical protein